MKSVFKYVSRFLSEFFPPWKVCKLKSNEKVLWFKYFKISVRCADVVTFFTHGDWVDFFFMWKLSRSKNIEDRSSFSVNNWRKPAAIVSLASHLFLKQNNELIYNYIINRPYGFYLVLTSLHFDEIHVTFKSIAFKLVVAPAAEYIWR